MEEVAFAVVSTPYVEWDFYSATSVSSIQTTSRLFPNINDDWTANPTLGDCFPPQPLGSPNLEDERSTSIENDPYIDGLTLAERLEPARRSQSPGGFLDSERILKCQSLDPATGRNCNIVYSRREDFIRHEAMVHYAPGNQHHHHQLRCSFCSTVETFPRKSSLTRHMKSTHPGIPWSIRPSQCPVCGIDKEQFKQDASLNVHMAAAHPDVTWPHPTPRRYTRLALSRGPCSTRSMNPIIDRHVNLNTGSKVHETST